MIRGLKHLSYEKKAEREGEMFSLKKRRVQGYFFFNFPILRGDIKKGESDFFL